MSACCFFSVHPLKLSERRVHRNRRRLKPLISCELLEVEARFKKNVAMWVGYVGTNYRGLQIQRGVHGVRCVEDELEQAIYKCGGISESNHQSLGKIRWKRSSRTDKGVHSLCTVITMKLEITSNAWINDLDGILIADDFNSHLPADIRILGVVPVTKTFNARTSCYSRTYDYYFPASCIGIKPDESPPPEVEQKLESFESILNLFQGRHAFHNYTTRKLYRSSQRKCSKRNDAAVSDDDDQPEEENELSFKPQQRAYWVDESQETEDVVGGSHYRRITSCSCEGLEKLHDHLVVKVRVTGESFMVHQIRKMIGTAIAVAREILPVDTISISLHPQARIILPMAPAQGLVLSGNSFFPFKGGHARAQGGAGFYFSKLGIHISDRISERMNSFWTKKISPAISQSMNELEAPWSTWLDSLASNRIQNSELEPLRKN